MKMTLKQRDHLITAIQAVLGTLIILLSVKESAKLQILKEKKSKRKKLKK